MSDEKKLGFMASWSMAVGGMIGGGIFATLGVVISLAGNLAWLSFLIGGAVAFVTGRSYARLTVECDRGGGVYRFLCEEGYDRIARVTAWVLIMGYILTVSVYAFTFGAYLAHALNGPAWLPQACAAASIVLLAGVNLMGVGEASSLEIGAVWFKLVVLVGLAAFGLIAWAPQQLELSSGQPGPIGSLVGAASVFMAYEGFQLLAYDYDDMREARTTITSSMRWAIVVTVGVYIMVALGVAMLVGADAVVAKMEVALADAGRRALGSAGFWLVTVAAAFSTASAINATLFGTARLSRDVAEEHGLPGIFAKENGEGVPFTALLIIAGVAIALAMLGGLQQLVQGASFVFLTVFGIVNWIAYRRGLGGSLALVGAFGCVMAIVTLVAHFFGLV